ncbi:MAG: outer membrane beta-barrel domain-containing protein [Verrucomicrobia bacterium]|nr:outer membrane beta-barrel domain-containing protein [Deltaproteobacteria bacterium]
MKKKIALLIAASLLAMATAASAANKAGTVSITPVVGAHLFDGEQHLEANDMYGARIGYNFTKAFGIEGLFDYSHNNKSTTHAVNAGISMYRYGGQLLYHFVPDNAFVPYIAAGYSGVNFDGNSDGYTDKSYKDMKSAFDYGVGAKYFVTENVALRGDVRHMIYKYDQTYNNYDATVGVYMAFGGAEPVVEPVTPEPTPEPVVEPVVEPAPAPAPVDSDNDGVADPDDKCLGTPAGVSVGPDGCPLDADKDGVADYLDKCFGTPAGVAVGPDGCPLDADKDGVADYLDKCPGTPAGEKVDMNGCTVVVVPVETKAAAAERFCSKPAVLAIHFDTDKTDIKPNYHDELKTVGDFLSYFPEAKGEISGHADTVGSMKYNLDLSAARAANVKKYIVDNFGVAASRVSSKGYGYTKPVASNKTKAGRAKNRRIEANFTCE